MNSKKPLYMIIATFILPIVFATVYYFWLNPENINTTNVGTLINPPVHKNDWVDSTPSKEHHWQLVLVHPEACEMNCESLLARLVSVQLALQKDIPRTEVALWSNTDAKLQLKGIKLEHLKSKNEKPFFVIVDPLGNIMLRYELSSDTSGIFRDLKKLLKVSQIG